MSVSIDAIARTCTQASRGHEILRGVDLEVALRRSARADGPERIGQVDAVARAHGPRRLRSDARVGHDRRRRAARPARRGSARSAGCSSRCSIRSRCPACRSRTLVGARTRAAPTCPTAGRRARRARSACPPSCSRAASTTSSPAARRSAPRRCSSRCSKPKFAVLDEIDSGLDVDALRDVARRVERMTRTTTSACSRSRTTRGCSPSCGPTACT